MVVKSADPPPRLSDAMFLSVVCNPPPYGVDHVPCPVAGCDAVAPLLQTRTPWDSDAEGPEGMFGPSAESTPRRAGSETASALEGTVAVDGPRLRGPEGAEGLGSPTGLHTLLAAPRAVATAAASGAAGLTAGRRSQTALPAASSSPKKAATTGTGATGTAAASAASGYASGYTSGYASVGGSSVSGSVVGAPLPATIRDMPVLAPRRGTKKGSAVRVRVTLSCTLVCFGWLQVALAFTSIIMVARVHEHSTVVPRWGLDST